MLNTDIDINTGICDIYDVDLDDVDLDELDNVYNEYNILYEQEVNYNNTYIFYYMFSSFVYVCILASQFTDEQKNKYIYLLFIKKYENYCNQNYILNED